MSGPDSPDPLAARLRTLRVIVGVLCLGVLTFLAVALAIRASRPTPLPPSAEVLVYIGLAFAVGAVLLAFGVLPVVLDAAWRKQVARGKWPDRTVAPGEQPGDPVIAWCGLYQTRTIIQAALLEGAAFFQVIAYLQAGQPLSLGLTLGLVLGMTLLFPRRETVERWIAVQRDRIEQGR